MKYFCFLFSYSFSRACVCAKILKLTTLNGHVENENFKNVMFCGKPIFCGICETCVFENRVL